MWIHAKPDANALQTDPTFNDLQGYPLLARRMTGAFDNWANTIVPPGNARPRTIHIGVHQRQVFLNEGASRTMLLQGSSDSWVHPLWNTISNCTCAQDGIDPLGLPTFALTPTTTNGTHYYGQTVAFPSGLSCISFYVKANGYTGCNIGLWDDNNATYFQGGVDLATGLSTGGGITVSSQSLGGGWYRVWTSRSFSSGASANSNFSINIGSNPSTFTFAGDGVSGILCTQPAIEPGRSKPSSWISSRNMCPHSTDVSDASWGPSHITVTANQAADPLSGFVTASLLTEDSTSNAHVITQSITSINGLYLCHSVYYKPTGRTWILLNNGGTGNGSWFNCSGAGAVGSSNGTICNAGIEQLSGMGAGWYRCWFIAQAGASNSTQLYTTTGNLVSSYLGTGIGCGYAADFQVEPVGLNVTPYPDAANIVQAASNLADTGHWSGGAILGVSSFVTDPFGGTNAFKLTNGSGGPFDALFQALTLPANGPVLISMYLKWGNTTSTSIQLYDATVPMGRGLVSVGWNGSGVITGIGSSAGLTVLGYLPVPGAAGWYRLMALSTGGVVAGNANGLYVYPGVVGSQAAGDFCYAYGPQVTVMEPGTYWGVNATVCVRDTDGIYANLTSITDPRTNLVPYSQQFDNANWAKTAVTITPNAGVDPNGTMYATDFVEDSSTGNHYMSASAFGSAGNIVFAFRVKPTGRNWCVLTVYDNGAGYNRGNYFGLTGSGVVGSGYDHGVTSASITGPDAHGFYRCVIVCPVLGSYWPTIVSASADGVSSNPGLNASAFQIFGAFVVTASVDPGPVAYIPTGASGVSAPQAGLSTTDGSMLAIAIPSTGNSGSGNFYSHVGNAYFVMDPGGQWYRDAAYNEVTVTQTLDQLNCAMLTWSTEADELIVYGDGLPLASVNFTPSHCPLTASVEGIPIGSLFGTNNMEGWCGLFYIHGRAYTAAEVIVFKEAIQNA